MSVEGQIVMTRPAGAFAEGWPIAGSPKGAIDATGAPRLSRRRIGVVRICALAPHPIEKIGPDQHAEAAAGIGERRRVPPGIIGVR
jgi:hypothetical protein